MCRRKLYSVILACTVALSLSVPALAADGEVRVGYSNSTVTLADEPVVAGANNTKYTMLIVPVEFDFSNPNYALIYYIDQIDNSDWPTVFGELQSVGTKGVLSDGEYKVLIGADNAENPTTISFRVYNDHGISNIKVLGFKNATEGSKAFSVALSGYNKTTDAYKVQFYYDNSGTEKKSECFEISELEIPDIENGAILTVGYQMNNIPEAAYRTLGAKLIASDGTTQIIDFGSTITKTKTE